MSSNRYNSLKRQSEREPTAAFIVRQRRRDGLYCEAVRLKFAYILERWRM